MSTSAAVNRKHRHEPLVSRMSPTAAMEGVQLMEPGVGEMNTAIKGKTVFLIRHAESENNVSKRVAKGCCRAGGCCRRLPTCAEICSVLGMATCPMNTSLSAAGRDQVGITMQSCSHAPSPEESRAPAARPHVCLTSSSLPGEVAAEKGDRGGWLRVQRAAAAADTLAFDSGGRYMQRALWWCGERHALPLYPARCAERAPFIV